MHFEINSGYEITLAIDRIHKEVVIPFEHKFKDGHVFDENKSVKWNREEVVRQNALIDQRRKDAYEHRNRLYTELHNAAIHYVMCDLDASGKKISDEDANKIISYAKKEHDNEWGSYLDSLLDFLAEILK
jgi:hypothetical protein